MPHYFAMNLTITDVHVTFYLQIIDFQFPSCCTSQPPKKLNQIITVNSSTNTPRSYHQKNNSCTLCMPMFSYERPLLAWGKIFRYFATIMDRNRDSTHQSQNEDNFRPFLLGQSSLMRQKKRKTMEKETRYQRHQDLLHCSRVKCNFDRKTLVKPNKLQTGLFHPSKVNLSLSVLKLLNMKLKLSKERLK